MTNHDLDQIPVASNLPGPMESHALDRTTINAVSMAPDPPHRTARALHFKETSVRAAIRARHPCRVAVWERQLGADLDLRSPDDGSVRWLTGSSGRSGSTCCGLSAAFYTNPENDLSGITDSRRAEKYRHTHRRCVPVRSDRGLVRISVFRNPAGSRAAKPTQVE